MTILSLALSTTPTLAQSSNQRLDRAIRDHDLSKIQEIIQNRGQVIYMEGEGSDLMPTPLFTAAYSGDQEIVRLLIDAGADINVVNSFGDNALYLALISKHIDTAECILNAGATLDPVFDRTQYMLGLFITRYPDFAVLYAEAHPDFSKRMLDNELAIEWAFERSSGNFASKLLEQNPEIVWNLSDDGENLLHFAARSGNIETAKALLDFEKEAKKRYEDARANKDSHASELKPPFDLISQISRSGFTAADTAILHGEFNFVRFLKEQNNGKMSWGKAPIKSYNATFYMYPKTIEQLLEAYDMQINDLSLEFPAPRSGLIHAAAFYRAQFLNRLTDWDEVHKREKYIMQTLLDHGADINLRDGNGDSALKIAVDMNNLELAKFLLEKGAAINFDYELGAGSDLSPEMQELLRANLLLRQKQNQNTSNGD